MGLWLSILDDLYERWDGAWLPHIVWTTEHRCALGFKDQRGDKDGAGMFWNNSRKSVQNKMEFCSTIGHDCDVRTFLYPIIDDRFDVILETYLRAEYELDPQAHYMIREWDPQEIMDVWSVWRMCDEQNKTFSTSQTEVVINIGLAGCKTKGKDVFKEFFHTKQYELSRPYGMTYEAMGFIDFAWRFHYMTFGHLDDKPRESVTKYIQMLINDVRRRRFGLPYRIRGHYHLF